MPELPWMFLLTGMTLYVRAVEEFDGPDFDALLDQVAAGPP